MDSSLQLLPEQPLAELIDVIRLADELGFRGCYSADETYHKDMWILFGAAAPGTRRIRFGPEVSGVILRDPTLIAQQAATLDELTDGRAEPVRPADRRVPDLAGQLELFADRVMPALS